MHAGIERLTRSIVMLVPRRERGDDGAGVGRSHRRTRSRVSLTSSAVRVGSSMSGMATTCLPRFCNVMGVETISISIRPSAARISRNCPGFRFKACRRGFGTTIRPAASMVVFMVIIYHNYGSERLLSYAADNSATSRQSLPNSGPYLFFTARSLGPVGSSPGFVPRCIPTWPHIPGKFTRPSHLNFAAAPNSLFSGSGSATRVGSIPIVRSTLNAMNRAQLLMRRAPVHLGD